MKIDITRPLQLLQWSSYLGILVLVKLFVILPLAAILFNDFYLRLLPPDSSQWVPLSTFDISQDSAENNLVYDQTINRVLIERALPKTIDNGISQKINLRDHILYKVDLDTKFYCLPTARSKGQTTNIEELEIEIYSSNKPESLIYRRTIPIVCMRPDDSINIMELYKFGPSRLELFRKEWLNHFKAHDRISITSEMSSVRYVLKVPKSHKLVIQPDSGFRFRMSFEQGLRNVMLRWHKFSYAVGIVIFDLAISSLFVITAFFSFFLIMRRSSDKKDD
ncbi:hypothetical protein HG536_0E01870 [Torulaspora globosa]|uniref:Seipin n=1 Tax=Torulaspora globosa TaxID=48254 RepID=A0A7G3ZIE0_9SACH|nr:uncharacterized protein HG536_0E01870 [Torulaspora globosa]QLL33276.1 hypothetical protein HG536_0E01870 [Torulaspora globosa]